MNPLIVSDPYGAMYSVIVQCNVCTIQFVCSTWAEAQQSALRVFLSTARLLVENFRVSGTLPLAQSLATILHLNHDALALPDTERARVR